MKTIHEMQISRRIAAIYARPLVEPSKAEVTLDSLAAGIEAIRIEVAACRTLIAEIHEVLGIAYKPSPEECEPDEPF